MVEDVVDELPTEVDATFLWLNLNWHSALGRVVGDRAILQPVLIFLLFATLCWSFELTFLNIIVTQACV